MYENVLKNFTNLKIIGWLTIAQDSEGWPLEMTESEWYEQERSYFESKEW